MGEWSRTVGEYRRTLGINEEKLRNNSREEIKNEIQMRDSMRWEEEKESKTTLELYSRCKKKIGEEQIYENDFNSVLLYRCRSNTLKLKWRNRFAGGDERCDLCGGSEVETLEHFLLDCVSL